MTVTSPRVADAPPRPTPWSALRPVLLRLHFYAGILVGPFLLVAAVTGLLYAAAPQAEAVVHRQQLTVDEVGTTTLSLRDQLGAVRGAPYEGRVVEVVTGGTPDATTRIVLAPEGRTDGRQLTVFVDPYTGEVRGVVPTLFGFLPVRATLDQLHANLLLGEPGRVYSELAASWLWVVVLGGVVQWVARSARRGRLRRLVVPERAATGRRRTRSWHGTVGLVVALGLLALSATGLTWSARAGANITDLRTAWGWTATPLATTIEVADGEVDPHAEHRTQELPPDAVLTMGVGIDGVLAAARADGLRDPLRLTPPPDPAEAWAVTERGGGLPTQADAVAVDAWDGSVVARVDFADQNLAAKLARWGIDAHMGQLFGVVNQLLLAGLALGLVVLVVLGYRMWWQRRPTRAPGFGPGPLLPPGGLRRLPWPVAAALFGAAALVGWFVPLFGIPLLGFLVLDVALAARARRRAAAG